MTRRPEISGAVGGGEAPAAPEATCTATKHGTTRYAYRTGCRCPSAIEASREYNRNYYRAARAVDAFRERHNEATRLSKQRRRADPAARAQVNAQNRRWARERRERGAHDTRHAVDDVVVRRLIAGEAVTHNRAERREAVRQLRDRRVSYDAIADRLHVHPRQVHRDITELGLIDSTGAVA